MNILKTFSDNSFVYYDRGRFDDYCVYLEQENVPVKAPRDYEYFQYFIDLSFKYGNEKIYSGFCKIYNKTTNIVDKGVLDLITQISLSYNNEDTLWVDKWFTVIYLGMVAEERKANAILKKRIKRLGFHQIINENYTAYEAANFSKGKKANVLIQECKKRGF